MKPTKRTESEVWNVYENWLDSYVNVNSKTYSYFLDDHYHFIGSSLTEEFLYRKDSTYLLEASGDRFAGKTQLRKETKIIEQFVEIVVITHMFDAWFLNDKTWSLFAHFRFTSTLQKKKEGWRFIYQHFFTTKPTGQRTGLGFSISYDIVTKGHAGQIAVESTASKGTTFTITLPINQDK